MTALNSDIGKPERATQRRVIAWVRDELHYTVSTTGPIARTTAGFFLLCSFQVAAADDATRFREFATSTLLEMGLRETDQGAYVCVSVNGAAAAESLLASLRAKGIRDVGPPGGCACVESEPSDHCTRTGSSEPACTVSVGDFQFRISENSSATLLVSCGWPRGSGKTAEFEQHGVQWFYVGVVSAVKF